MMSTSFKTSFGNRRLSAGILLADFKTPWNFLAEMPAQARAFGAGAVNSDANQFWWCHYIICANFFPAENKRMSASRVLRTPV